MRYLYNTQHVDINGVVELPMPPILSPYEIECVVAARLNQIKRRTSPNFHDTLPLGTCTDPDCLRCVSAPSRITTRSGRCQFPGCRVWLPEGVKYCDQHE